MDSATFFIDPFGMYQIHICKDIKDRMESQGLNMKLYIYFRFCTFIKTLKYTLKSHRMQYVLIILIYKAKFENFSAELVS